MFAPVEGERIRKKLQEAQERLTNCGDPRKPSQIGQISSN